MSKNIFTAKKLAFSGASIALATVTANFIKTPSLPFGGSATLFSMFFAALPGYLFGPVTGLAAALAHGIIQFISKPYYIHPVQVLLDYILAFGALGLSGFYANKKHGLLKGYTMGVLGRFVFVNISGFIFYTSYIGVPGTDIAAMWASLIYNASYILPEYIITMILLFIPAVRKALGSIKRMTE